MEGFLSFFKELLIFDAYWKVVVLIVLFGTICAYVFTSSLKDATTKYFASQKKPVPPWRGFMLTCFSSFVGTAVGLSMDLSILPIYETVADGETPRLLVGHYYLLSAQCGIGAGILSSATVPLVRRIIQKKFKGQLGSKDDKTTPSLGSWTLPLDQKELLESLPEDQREEAAKIFHEVELAHKDEKGKTERGVPTPGAFQSDDDSTLSIALKQASLEKEMAELEQIRLAKKLREKAEEEERTKRIAEKKAQLEKELAELERGKE